MDPQTGFGVNRERLRRAAHALAGFAALAFGALLLWSAVVKALDPPAFITLVRAHGVVPEGLIGPLAWSLIAVEAALGLACLVAATMGAHARRWALWGVAALFLGFGVYALLVHLDPPPKPAPCGCPFGSGTVDDWRPIMLRSGVVAGAAAALALGAGRHAAPVQRRMPASA